MTFYEQLQNATETERHYLLNAPAIQACMAGQAPLERYLAFLENAYHHVKHTVPLMMAAGTRLNDDQEWIRQALVEYIEEEYGHHEWILNDIAAAGGDAEAVRHSQPNFATEVMVSYFYDLVNRKNPLGLFGMVFVLEGTSVNLATAMADIIRQQLRLPQSAFSYLYSHGALDVDHLDFFKNLMNKLTREEDKAAIIHAARRMFRLYGDMMRSLPMEASQ